MSLSTLNEDVLRIIAEMLSATQCIPLSSVSRDLHAIARQYVFASITVRSEEQLVKIHDHLIRNIDNRLLWPRELTIYGPTEMPPAAPVIDALVGIFEHAQELRFLEVHDCESLIDCNARLGEHLAALPHLSAIHLFNIGAQTLDALHKMVSRPEKACLSFTTPPIRRSLLRIAEGPVLGNVKRLTLRHFEFNAISEWQLLSKLTGAHPQLEVLDLDHRCVVYPCLILFPNIRRLTIADGIYGIQDPGNDVEPRRLDYLSFQPSDLHLISTLGIRSDYLRLYTEWLDFDPSGVDHELVSAAAVLELSLYQVERHTEFCLALAQAISAKWSRMRYLIWTIKTDDPHTVRWMEDIVFSLSSSQLLSIRLHVAHPRHTGPSHERWLGLLQRLEHVHISSVPSLRFYCQVLSEWNTDNTSKITWGRVEGDGGRRTLQPIPSWQGERIHRYLQSPQFCRTLRFDEEAALQYTGR
ncbi:uncharacterized protein B0H18DRAFT_1212000 [Fomitopsis serialis]|uniref:uncharacterized protein n=1 Tax=Fomitopsis serialis TaxID=139415 RepID=UPI0020072BCC|nr:uncharacterized protein B0H18DRAFT_1212000 [Neoantrodia serialis]KAH9924045.1 hypothetical protein B0H18DRAFT_1212000 [Neoantrodia serialis]